MIRRLKRRISDQIRLRYVVTGVVLIYVSLIAQFTSNYTPVLASYEPALVVVSHLGSYSLLVAVLMYAGSYAMSGQKVYFLFAIISAIALLFVTLTSLGLAFQLGITGLTLGSSLIVLGYYHVRNGRSL